MRLVESEKELGPPLINVMNLVTPELTRKSSYFAAGGIRKSTRLNPALLTNRELDVLRLLQEGLQNKEIAAALFIAVKTVEHHVSSILFKLDVQTRARAVNLATRLQLLK